MIPDVLLDIRECGARAEGVVQGLAGGSQSGVDLSGRLCGLDGGSGVGKRLVIRFLRVAGQALAVLLELSQLVSGGILGSGQSGLLGLSLGLFGGLALSLGALGLGLCWKAGVAAEVIGLSGGTIGERLYTAKVYFQTPDLFAWTAVIVLISALFEKLFLFAVDRLAERVGA